MTTRPPLTLISHALCPYVQRAAIVLAEKGQPFVRRDIDLARKPDWFLALSPLGKTPVLQVGDEALFESAVICEYLDDTLSPRLHPQDALLRARHRAWMEFGSALLQHIGAFYSAPDDATLHARGTDIRQSLMRLEATVAPDGPYFAGPAFSLVDAVFGPVMRYFDVLDAIAPQDWWAGLPRVAAWRLALARRPSVQSAVRADYPQALRAFVVAKGGAAGQRLSQQAAGCVSA